MIPIVTPAKNDNAVDGVRKDDEVGSDCSRFETIYTRSLKILILPYGRRDTVSSRNPVHFTFASRLNEIRYEQRERKIDMIYLESDYLP